MGLELITYSISDIGKVITGKTPPASIKSAYSALDGVPFVTPKDMDGRRWIENTERYLTSDGVAAVKRNLVPAMSVAVSCIGSDMGKAVLLKKESITNQQINSIVIDVKRFNPKYIYYVLSTKQQYFKDIAGGSATPILNKTDFGKITFQAPSKYYQDLIVEYLDCLDSKRELNRQINQTLEQMAQALFKSWFVDFDPVIDNALDAGFFEQDLALPDELLRRAEARRAVRERGEFKPLPDATRQLFPAAFEDGAEPSVGLGGWVPKGWQVQSIKDFANVTDFVANGSFAALKENVTLFDNPEYALYIRTTDFKNDFDKEKAKYIDKHAYEFLSKTKLSGAEVIISNVGDVGTVFRPPSWLGMPMTLGSNAIAISTQSLNDYLYFYFLSQAGQSAIDGIVSGSAQQKFNKTGFRSLRLLLPSNNVVIKFNEVYQDISSKIISNKKNIRHLELLRDTLLPKLISGELRLDNIDAELAKVDVA
ncbi:restriction endonuclease subunit S [Aeromonas veronii]|uniref:restriction endonuclease subunit S n=1 Tax=Aeromonas veronii TaxID=654 RepID=UPI003006AAB8